MANGVPLRAYWLGVGTEVSAFDGKSQQSSTTEEMLWFDNLQFTANFTFDADSAHTSSDDSVLEVYNLNPETRAAFHQHGATVMLRAGYDTDFKRDAFSGDIQPDYESLPVVYLGTVINAIDRKVAGGVDRITKVWLSTDKLERCTIKHSTAYTPDIKRADVIKDLVKKMNMPVIRMDLQTLGDTSYPSGYSVFGNVADALTTACKENGLQWTVHNKAISVTRADNLLPGSEGQEADAWLMTPEQILQLEGYFERQSSPDTGTGTAKSARAKTHHKKRVSTRFIPEDTKTIKSGGIKTKTRQGVNMTVFLNGFMKMHDLVKIEGMNEYLPDSESFAANADGLYRIINISHDLDFFNGDWSTQIKLIPAVG